MANSKSKITLPNGDQIEGNWATEETMSNVLTVLEKAYGKGKSGSGAKQKADEKAAKTTEYASKTIKGLSERSKTLTNQIRSRIQNEKDLIRTNKGLAEAMDLASDSSKIAGRGIRSLGSAIGDAVEEIEKLDGSARGASDAFFKIVGSAGALGTAFGIAAGIIDQFAEFQVAAIQTGFSFSQELVNTRNNIANLGMNMMQLSEILTTNGEAIRSLGGTSSESVNSFITLVGNVKDAAREFGLFGMTTQEIAGLTAERIDLLRRQGFMEQVAIDTATDSFNTLNQEVLAYARMTGRERREIMRNNLNMQQNTELLLADLSRLGPNATVSFDAMMQSMSAVFGSGGDEFADIFTRMVTSHFRGGMEMLSADQLAAMGQVPGLRELFMTARDQFISNADNPSAMRQIQLDFAQQAGNLIQDATDRGLVDLAYYQEGSPVGDYLRTIIGAGQAATNFLALTAEEIELAFNEEVANSEMMMLRDRIQILQNQFQAMLVRAFTMNGELEDLLSDENFQAAQDRIEDFGDMLVNVMNFFANIGSVLADMAGIDGEGRIADAFIGGITAMFAAQGAVTLAMVAGVNGMWSLVSSLLRPGSAPVPPPITGGSPAAGGRTSGGGRLGSLGRVLGLLGIAIGSAQGYYDDEYEAAGYSGIDRAGLGVAEGTLGFLDLASNLLGDGIDRLLGTDMFGRQNLAGGFRSLVTNPDVASWLQPYNWGNDDSETSAFPAWDPSTMLTRSETDNMVVQGASANQDGTISAGMLPSNAWRFRNSSDPAQRDEAERLLQAMRDVATEIRRLARIVEDNS